jgi:hypothetical protein
MRAMDAAHINLVNQDIETLMFQAGQKALDAIGEERDEGAACS